MNHSTIELAMTPAEAELILDGLQLLAAHHRTRGEWACDVGSERAWRDAMSLAAKIWTLRARIRRLHDACVT